MKANIYNWIRGVIYLLIFSICNNTFGQTPSIAEVILPQYIQGINTTNNNRVPFAFRVTISGLIPNATYRYFNQVVTNSDNPTTNGAGNVIFVTNTGNFIRATSPGMNTNGSYGEFTTNASGTYTGWFITEPTANNRFTPGNYLFMRIMLNNGNNGTTVAHRLTTTDSVRVINFGTNNVSTQGTGIYGNSFVSSKNFVLLYDNTGGNGRPITSTFIEDDGTSGGNNYASFYQLNVDGQEGFWGCIIPNDNPNGIRRIEFRDLNSGNIIYYMTDSDGDWNGLNTVDPTSGINALNFLSNFTEKFTVQSSNSITLRSNNSLIVTDTLTNNGTITLEATSKTNYARLIYGAVAGTGTMNHQMRLVPGSSFKWYGIGSPIDGININSIGSGQFTSTSVYSWGATTGWSPAHTSTFSRGQGYLIAAGENSPHGFFTIPADNSNITFSGTLNANTSAVVRTMSWGDAPTGVTFTSDSTKGWNLLANPYHADFDVNLLTLDNQSLEKSLYIRTTTGYVAYNPVTNTPDSLRYLAPGQGFFVRATADAQTFTFDLSRRSASGSNGLQKPQFTFDKINIRVFTGNRADDTYVIFKSDATPAFDGLYDAYKLNNVAGHPMLYTRLNNLNYAINTLPELSGQFSLPMHFSCSEGGQYSITLPAQQDFDPSVSIVLEDKLLKTHTLLNNADYTFTHNPVNNPDRFVLHFSKSQVSAEEFAADAFNAWVYNGILYLKGFKNLGTTSISLVDMSGRVVYSTRADVHSNERVEIELPKLATGMYVLRVASGVQSRSMKVLLN